jgi:hypothetical protein
MDWLHRDWQCGGGGAPLGGGWAGGDKALQFFQVKQRS